jgi:hypothetical protein
MVIHPELLSQPLLNLIFRSIHPWQFLKCFYLAVTESNILITILISRYNCKFITVKNTATFSTASIFSMDHLY